MGYQIETYSLSELNSLSIPGKVVPALFWLIPIGKWKAEDLNSLWNYFTQESNYCNDLGLMLIKNPGNYRNFEDFRTQERTHISDLSAKLEELLPQGIKSIYDPNYFNSPHHQNQVLIFSGFYPQPGWGVFLSFSSKNELLTLINKVVSFLPAKNKNAFIKASKSYIQWTVQKENIPKKPDIPYLLNKKEKFLKITTQTEPLLTDINQNKFNVFHFEILNKIYNDEFNKDGFDKLDEFLKIIPKEFLLANQILKICQTRDPKEVNESLHAFIKDHDQKRNNLFKKTKDDALKKIAALILKINNFILPDDIEFWAREYYNANIGKVTRGLQAVNNYYNTEIGQCITKISNANQDYKTLEKEWSDLKESLRLQYHQSFEDVLSFNINYAPAFLTMLELEALQMNLTAKSVSWDPARMVGWKLAHHGNALLHIDLEDFIKKTVSKTEYDNNFKDTEISDKDSVNGSLFTDYVHYLATTNTKYHARAVTKNIFSDLLRKGEIITIIKKYEDLPDIRNVTNEILIEKLLSHFGWPDRRIKEEITLADCIQKNGETQSINIDLNGNDIRKICESFCKDFIDTLTYQLGYSENELWKLITEKRPDYHRQQSRWSEHINKITIGSAAIIIKILLNETLPLKTEEARAFNNFLGNMEKKLNPLSHHKSEEIIDPDLPKDFETSQLIDEIIGLLKYSNELIGEMPWHFYPNQKTGHQPKVLSGNAWSHSHKQRRQINVILWTDFNDREKLLIWNPSRINPVIPDGKIIERP